jgi:hypothetical protein
MVDADIICKRKMLPEGKMLSGSMDLAAWPGFEEEVII